MRSSNSRWRVGELLASVGIVGCLVALVGPVISASIDRNQLCVQHAYSLSTGILSYIQDYDEQFPQANVWNNPRRFRSAVGPYVGDHSTFRCPATGAFYANNSVIGGKSLAAFEFTDSVELFRDAEAHSDGKFTVAFMDGHVERGGVDQLPPDISCRAKVAQIVFALAQYSQDYDEKYPFQKNDAQFRAVLQPYLNRSKTTFVCPDTKLDYTLGQSFRGHSSAELGDISTIVAVQDSARHKDGILTTGYLDGYVEQRDASGAIIFPAPASTSKSDLQQLSIALLEYTQDYDGNLPPLQSHAVFEAAIKPYVRSSRIFAPVAPYHAFELNSSLSGQNYATFPAVASTEWIRDTNNYGDGLITIGYLDGHVVRTTP